MQDKWPKVGIVLVTNNKQNTFWHLQPYGDCRLTNNCETDCSWIGVNCVIVSAVKICKQRLQTASASAPVHPTGALVWLDLNWGTHSPIPLGYSPLKWEFIAELSEFVNTWHELTVIKQNIECYSICSLQDASVHTLHETTALLYMHTKAPTLRSLIIQL